jgi:hypothetical protein
MERTSLVTVALGLALASCHKPKEQPTVPIEAAQAPSNDAAKAAILDSGERDAGPPLVDLLRTVPAAVGVSSAVRNKTDDPWHLVDGDTSTAWGSKTGDLVGAWIGVRVPQDAFVDHLELVVGFDREKDGLDLFSANHRITRVGLRIVEPGAHGCGEVPKDLRADEQFALEPRKRGFQRVPVNKPGGVMCLWVLGTLAGTKPAWREVVVSELRVMGTPGKERTSGLDKSDVAELNIPGAFGSIEDRTGREGQDTPLELERHGLAAQPFRSLGDLCAAFTRAWKEDAKASEKTSHWPPSPATVSCRETPLPVAFTPAPPFVSAHAVEVKDGRRMRRLVVAETKDGHWLTPLGFAEQYYVESDERIRWLRHAVEALRVENGHLLLVLDYQYTSSSPLEYRVYPALVRSAAWCSSSAGRLACREWNPDLAPPLAIKRKDGERDVKAVEALPWKAEVAFSIDAQGKLVKR